MAWTKVGNVFRFLMGGFIWDSQLYKTGRSRIYTFTGNLTVGGDATGGNVRPNPYVASSEAYASLDYPFYGSTPTIIFSAISGIKSPVPYEPYIDSSGNQFFPKPYYCPLYISIETGFETSHLVLQYDQMRQGWLPPDHWAQVEPPTPRDPSTLHQDNTGWKAIYNGTYTFTVPVEEYFCLTIARSGSDPGNNGFPSFYTNYTPKSAPLSDPLGAFGPYGTRFLDPDGHRLSIGTLFESYKAGSNIQGQASVGPLVVSVSDPVPSNYLPTNPFDIPKLLGRPPYMWNTSEAFTPALSAGMYAINYPQNSGSVTGSITGTFSDSNGNSMVIGQPASSSFSSGYADTSNGAFVAASYSSCSAYIAQCPPRSAKLNYRTRAMSKPWNGSVLCHYNAAIYGGSTNILDWQDGSYVQHYPFSYTSNQMPDDDRITSDATGSISRTDTQNFWYAETDVGDLSGALTYPFDNVISRNIVNSLQKARIYMDPSSVSSSSTGEGDPKDLRIPIRGPVFPVAKLSKLTSMVACDTNSTANWIPGANTVVTPATGGGVQLAVSANYGSVEKQFQVSEFDIAGDGINYANLKWGKDWGGFRYLRIVIQSVNQANQPVTVQLYSDPNRGDPPIGLNSDIHSRQWRNWTITTGGAGTDTSVLIDLCCSNADQTLQVDAQDGRFPAPDLWGDFWGVGYVTSVFFQGLNPDTYIIRSVTLVEQNYTNLTVLAARNAFMVNSPTNTGLIHPGYSRLLEVFRDNLNLINPYYANAHYGSRIIQASTDGKCSLDEPYLIMDSTNDIYPLHDNIAFYRINTIATLLQSIAQHPYWTVTNLAAGAPAFDDSLDSAYVFGGGDYYDYASKTWQSGFDIPLLNGIPITINGQILLDELDWYPWCGNPWIDNGPYTGDTPIAAEKILRNEAWGIVFDQNNTAKPGVSVIATDDVSGRDAGTATSVGDGTYQTDAPFGTAGNVLLSVAGGHAVTPVDDSQWFIRRKTRGCFKAPAPGYYTDSAVNQLGMFYRVGALRGDVWLWRANCGLPDPAYDLSIQVTRLGYVSDPAIALEPSGRVRILYAYNKNVWEIVSDDEGATWSSPIMAIPGGVHPKIVVGHVGQVIRAAMVPGTPNVIRATVQWAGDAAPSGLITFVDSSGNPIQVQDDTFGLTQIRDGAWRWMLSVVLSGTTTTTDFYSTDDSLWGQTINGVVQNATWTQIF